MAILPGAGLRAENPVGPGAGLPASNSLQHPSARETVPRPVGLIVNGRPAPEPALIAGSHDRIFIRRDDLAHAALLPQDTPAGLVIAGQAYVALSAITGLSARLVD